MKLCVVTCSRKVYNKRVGKLNTNPSLLSTVAGIINFVRDEVVGTTICHGLQSEIQEPKDRWWGTGA